MQTSTQSVTIVAFNSIAAHLNLPIPTPEQRKEIMAAVIEATGDEKIILQDLTPVQMAYELLTYFQHKDAITYSS